MTILAGFTGAAFLAAPGNFSCLYKGVCGIVEVVRL
jgi:hypothetical protein